MAIQVSLLRDIEHGGAPDQPGQVVAQLVDFINAARTSLHFAVYDFYLKPEGAAYAPIVQALQSRAAAGVQVQIAFNETRPISAGTGASPTPARTREFLEAAFGGTKVEFRGVTELHPLYEHPKLMHSKYFVRDGNTPGAAVWSGSLNLTDDSWTYQENNIVRIDSAELARYFETDFGELWASGDIDTSGADDEGTVTIGGVTVDVAFSPGEGPVIDARLARLIAGARRRIKLASMLISSRPVLEALLDARRTGQVPEFRGVYDSTQMEETMANWQHVPKNWPLIPMFRELAGAWAGKASLPYTPDGKHNFLHDKVLVCDDVVATGSFNLSHSATFNAENELLIHDRAIADRYSEYVDQLIAEYGKTE